MNTPLSNFERRLLAELRDVTRQRGPAPSWWVTWRSRVVIAAAGVAVGVVLAVGVLWSGHRGAPVRSPGSPGRIDSWTAQSPAPESYVPCAEGEG